MDSLKIINKILKEQLNEKNREIEILNNKIKKLERYIYDSEQIYATEQNFKKDKYNIFAIASDELQELK